MKYETKNKHPSQDNSMILYEVNLKISIDVYDNYMRWLKPHTEEMLTLGFTEVNFFKENSDLEEGFEKITVVYKIDNRDDLEYYLNNFSEKMRVDGLNKFKDKFSASRRILHEIFPL